MIATVLLNIAKVTINGVIVIGDIICGQDERFTHTVDGEDKPVNGCKYLYQGDLEYETVTHNCKENYIPPNCELKCCPEKTLAYNCSKHVGSNDESTCILQIMNIMKTTINYHVKANLVLYRNRTG